MTEFYGHGVFPRGIIPNVAAPLLTLAILAVFLWTQRTKRKKLRKVLSYLFFLFLPNAAYLFIEIRHILFQDNIADGNELGAVLVFSGLSLIGLLLAVSTTILAITNMEFLKKTPQRSIVFLSFISIHGAALGLMGLTSVDGIFAPWLVIVFSLRILSSVDWLTFVILLGTILSVITLFVWRIMKCILIKVLISV